MKKLYVLFILVAAIMAMGTGAVQAQRLDTRERTKQLRLSRRQMNKADIDLKRTIASVPKSDVSRQIEEVHRRIDFLQKEVIKYDSSSKQLPGIQNELYNNKVILADLQKRNNAPQPIKDQSIYQYQKYQKYANVYDSIVYDASKNPEKYKGLTRGELAEMLRYNFIRRNNLIYDLERDDLFQAVANGDSMLDLTHQRFWGIVRNDYPVPVTFWFQARNGGRDESIVVDPKSAISKSPGWAGQWLIEGCYLVHYSNGGQEICSPVIVNVGPHKTSIQVSVPVNPNAACWTFQSVRYSPYWQANMPGYGY